MPSGAARRGRLGLAVVVGVLVIIVVAAGAFFLVGQKNGGDGTTNTQSGQVVFTSPLTCGSNFTWDVQLPASTAAGSYSAVLTGTTDLGTWGALVTLDASHSGWREVDGAWRKTFSGQLSPLSGCSGSTSRLLMVYEQSGWTTGYTVTAGQTYKLSIQDAQGKVLAEGSFTVA